MAGVETGGTAPVWSRTRPELLFRGTDGTIMAAAPEVRRGWFRSWLMRGERVMLAGGRMASTSACALRPEAADMER